MIFHSIVMMAKNETKMANETVFRMRNCELYVCLFLNVNVVFLFILSASWRHGVYICFSFIGKIFSRTRYVCGNVCFRCGYRSSVFFKRARRMSMVDYDYSSFFSALAQRLLFMIMLMCCQFAIFFFSLFFFNA